MRTPTQTGILVGAVAGLLAAGIYWAMQTPALNGLLILIEILLASGAGVAAALIHIYNPTIGTAAPAPAPAPLGAPTLPTAPPAPPSDRSQRLRAAATAGGLAGLGWGLAGMVKVVLQITDPAFSAQLDSLIAQSGGSLPAGSGGTILGVGVLCAGCFALILFPGVGAGLGGVGGYILTALRPAASRPQ
jgi:hypothetical protein